MQMKNYQKFFAVLLALLIVVSAAGCSSAPKSMQKQWSYKTADTELPIGVYIYSMAVAYDAAEQFAQKTEGYDSEKGTYDGKDSFLAVEITDDDGNKAVAEEWIKTEADKITRNILAIDKLYNELGCTLDEADFDYAKQYASNNWTMGEGINEYGSQYAQYLTPAETLYSQYGISEESYYISTSKASIKQTAVFDAMYKEGGTQEVPQADIEKFFTDNYYSYSYISVPLYTTETAEDGKSTNTALAQEEIDKYTNNFKKYADKINSGTSYDAAIADYLKDYELDTDPTSSNIENIDSLSVGEEIAEKLKELKEGTATYFTVGETETKTYYFLYKEPIANEKDSYVEKNVDSILATMKNDEFQEFVTKTADELDVEINEYVNNYEPAMFEKEKEE